MHLTTNASGEIEGVIGTEFWQLLGDGRIHWCVVVEHHQYDPPHLWLARSLTDLSLPSFTYSTALR